MHWIAVQLCFVLLCTSDVLYSKHIGSRVQTLKVIDVMHSDLTKPLPPPPPLYRLVHVFSRHQLIGASNTGAKPSLILCRMVGGKGKLIFLLPRPAAIYKGGAASTVLTVPCWTVFRIRMDPHSIGRPDPVPHLECGSGTGSRRVKKS
jgi:hypothetical protein